MEMYFNDKLKWKLKAEEIKDNVYGIKELKDVMNLKILRRFQEWLQLKKAREESI
jgi:hypothetical protein